LELTETEAIALGHNYVGCEHVLLGLISEPDGTGGNVLRALGIDLRSTRRAVVAALSGYTHLRAQTGNNTPAEAATMIATAVRQELRPILDRIERLEHQPGSTSKG
jgi:ATP-dependent Clp protease ATP-binding subunit ClpC